MWSRISACAEDVLAAESIQEAARRFFAAMAPLGASYLQARVYRRPVAPLTAERHLAAGGIVARIAPTTWNMDSDACRYVCLDCNPLLTPIRESWTRYSFGDFAPHDDRRFGLYWDAMSEAGIAEALCATSYGEGGKIASLHLGFAHRQIEQEDVAAAQLSGLILTERLMPGRTAHNAHGHPADRSRTRQPRVRGRGQDRLGDIGNFWHIGSDCPLPCR